MNFWQPDEDWLALVIGNSSFHWAYFQGSDLQQSWDSEIASIPGEWQELPIYVASVVVEKLEQLDYPNQYIIDLDELPLGNIYPSLGIDRALNILGGFHTSSGPCLVIDGGTALTVTGIDQDQKLIGGAILPGLGLQFDSLATCTSALPRIQPSKQLAKLWGTSTSEAIQSGIIYSITQGINHFIVDWWSKFPSTPIIFTGGDGKILRDYLTELYPDRHHSLKVDNNLAFWGILSLLQDQKITEGEVIG